MFRSVLPIAATLGLLLGTPLAASALTIDDFAGTQAVSVGLGGLPNPVTESGGVAAGGAFGGSRSVVLERTVGGGSASVDVGFSASDALSVSTGAGVVANALLIYDGDTDSTPNTTGVDPTDVTEGGLNSIVRLLVEADQSDVVIRVTFHNGGANASVDLVTSGGNTFGAGELLVADISGLDQELLQSVRAITVEIFGPTSFDVTLSSFEVTVPEPGTLALLGLGLAGLAYGGRRNPA